MLYKLYSLKKNDLHEKIGYKNKNTIHLKFKKILQYNFFVKEYVNMSLLNKMTKRKNINNRKKLTKLTNK